MSLRPAELAQVVAELDQALPGAVVQKVQLPAPGLLYLEVRLPGRSVLLCVSVQPGLARLSVASDKPPSPPRALALQAVLRKQLTGWRISRVAAGPGQRVALLTLEKGGQERQLIAELNRGGALALTDEQQRLLALSAPPERGLRVGLSYAPRPAPEGEKGASRLRPSNQELPFASAAEVLLAQQGLQQDAQAHRRALLAPLRQKLARNARTLEKVRAEAGRAPEAERHRQEGELLARNLHLVQRGAREVKLTEYTEQGPLTRVVALDPALPPKAQAERHFHQYRRLLRGSEHAARRLELLQQERARLEEERTRLESLPDEALKAQQGGAPPPKKRQGPAPASPVREYRSARGERILVGKSASGNDVLTFKLARPQDLWLHVRGGTGSHVVVPLEKNAQLPQELLLDAAHLAIHHSASKGEPRAEVSYTQAKFVRRPKEGAPGQVLYSREKTLLVRVEPPRLQRLLQSESTAI